MQTIGIRKWKFQRWMEIDGEELIDKEQENMEAPWGTIMGKHMRGWPSIGMWLFTINDWFDPPNCHVHGIVSSSCGSYFLTLTIYLLRGKQLRDHVEVLEKNGLKLLMRKRWCLWSETMKPLNKQLYFISWIVPV
jgi:hypothetical protein